jgi:hypothetical protein
MRTLGWRLVLSRFGDSYQENENYPQRTEREMPPSRGAVLRKETCNPELLSEVQSCGAVHHWQYFKALNPGRRAPLHLIDPQVKRLCCAENWLAF